MSDRRERHASSDFGTDGTLGPHRPSEMALGPGVTFCHNRGHATMSMRGGISARKGSPAALRTPVLENLLACAGLWVP